ncbi:AMP-binding protein [Lampropedia aestuarii]|uniref:AMP-binding protein n=1 Tax=Lampropedia aestuarii TaxID=2562762 RepID=UPI002469B9B1|nr:AMP-binding protein [Lampropedia aestuarii]MDH5858444.1 AMP-binding protein [Lampropedia aestuarii]
MIESTHSTVHQGGTLGAWLLQALQRHPERIAVIDESRALSYRELLALVTQAANKLESLGLQQGDVVAQLSGNRIEMLAVMAAAYIRGFCSVTLHPMGSVQDHVLTLQDCQARVLIGESAYVTRLGTELSRCPQLRQCLLHSDAEGGFWHHADVFSGPALQQRGGSESIVRLAYTGGTTGRSKGVMLSNRAMLHNTQLWLSALAWPDGVRTLCSAPISHGAGSLVYPTFARGGTVVLERGFEVGRWLDTVQRERIGFTFIVPTMLYALLDDPRTALADLSSLQALVYGAAPASPARIRQALDCFGPVLVQTFGQSEAPNTILLLDQHDHESADARRLASAGRPFPGLDVALLDPHNKPVAVGEIGELCLRGPLVMSGYWGQDAQTAQALAGGWLHTGDMGMQDAQGYFFIVDRKKDMVISGGFNVYAREVEDVLCTHPNVSQAAVIGVPDDKWGEAVLAVVVTRSGTMADPAQLQRMVRDAKGPISTPKQVVYVRELPVTGLGKVDKKALRKLFADGIPKSEPVVD